MSSATFYKWRVKYVGMDTSMIKRLKELEDEPTHNFGTISVGYKF